MPEFPPDGYTSTMERLDVGCQDGRHLYPLSWPVPGAGLAYRVPGPGPLRPAGVVGRDERHNGQIINGGVGGDPEGWVRWIECALDWMRERDDAQPSRAVFSAQQD